MKREPFFRKVVCVKAKGGKRPLWHARLNADNDFVGSPCGAGNTADNAIKDLAKELRARQHTKPTFRKPVAQSPTGDQNWQN